MPSNYPVIAVTPAYGVRVSKEQDTVYVSINDHGGRGCPRAVIFVPVVEVNHKFNPLIPGRSCPPPCTLNELRDTADLKLLTDKAPPYKAPPYKAQSNRSEWRSQHLAPWPFDTDQVLGLLLYDQSPDVGGEPLVQVNFMLDMDATPPTPFDWEAYWPLVTKAVNERLEQTSADALRGGLIKRRGRATEPGAGGALRGESASSSASMSKVIFSLASCQYPSDIFDRMPDNAIQRGPADASLLALGDLLKNSGGPSLMLFVGDQVYVDATAGLFDPKIQNDRYRLPYEHRGESRGVTATMQYSDVDVYMMPDDHEIIDNWEPGAPPPTRGESAIKAGKDAYWKYQRFHPQHPKIWRDDIEHGTLRFFLGDTRTERKGRTAMNWRKQKIMKGAQFTALLQWLIIPKNANLPKFVSTASALLPRRLAVARDPACALHSDAWDGYPKSMHELLAYVCDHEIKGLVFLSGDEHISNCVWACVTDLHTGKQCTFHSVHSSALYAPYPFANAVKEDFARSETFHFPDPPDAAAGRYCCEVRTVFAPEGDGFALLTALGPSTSNGTGWQLNVAFHGANGPKEGGTHMLDLFPQPPKS